jgi:O-glycosyl hydrolase
MKKVLKLTLLMAVMGGINLATHAQTVVGLQSFDAATVGAFNPTYGSLYKYVGGTDLVATITNGMVNEAVISGNAVRYTSSAAASGDNFGVKSSGSGNLSLNGNTSTNLGDYTLSFDIALGAGSVNDFTADFVLYGGTDVGSGKVTGADFAINTATLTPGAGFVTKSVNMGTLPAGYQQVLLVMPNNSSLQWSIGKQNGTTVGTADVFIDNIKITMTATNNNGGSSSTNAGTASINPQILYQTIEGIGGATAFYDGWITAHPYKLEIYTNAFAGLNLSMLRLGNWYRYNDSVFNTRTYGEGWVAGDMVANANRILGHPVPVYMSSWSPPAFLKSNGQVGNGGTLIQTNGSFAYTNFAQYWYDSLQAYQAKGVSPTWISIQNEPDYVASYDSCILHPTEDIVNGTNYASYSKALDATYQLLTNNIPSPPKLLGPEPVHIAYNDLQNYAATMHSNSFYGINYHLYGNTSGNPAPDGYTSDLTSAANIFTSKPHFMTEYGYSDLIQTACLIHNCFTTGQASGFNYWSLIWPVGGNGLVQIENPFNSQSTWTNAPAGVTTQSHGWWLTPAYWAMKHFSYYIQPGYRRVSAGDTDSNVRSSAYLAPDGSRLVVVLINTNATVASAMTFNFGSFNVGTSSVYQTVGTNTYVGTNTFVSLGAVASPQMLPPLSVTTLVLNQNPTPPRITSFQLLGSSFAVAGTNGNAPGTYCYTMASTNLALPLMNWTVIATNQFGPGSTFNFTNSFDSSLEQQFFILRLP